MRYWGKGFAIAVTTAAVTAGLFSLVTQTATPVSAAGQDTPGRIAGKPDFNGIWEANNTANWDLQTHQARPMVGQPGLTPGSQVLAAPVVALGSVGWVPGGLGVVEGEEIPYQPWAAARKKENEEHWIDRDPEIKCFQPGIPRAMYMPHPFQVIQSATKIQMVFEFADAQRTIHLNKMEDYPNVLYMGYSVGRWEGDTLVVDVSDFTDATWFDRAGNFHSDALHVTERYTPMGRDAIRYEATMEDPKVFTRPWKISMPLYRRLEPNAQLTDFRCVEMVEETIYGHLRKDQLVKHWEGKTMNVDITRKIPPGEEVYERYISGNPPAAK
ncbi:MAG TPA: hypothetical protein VGQ49_18635 [Bryobacteraceae bacterium]|jgi:hypothetical protein|nr:hypothetical protein [Bryobacteraceae bacterium]